LAEARLPVGKTLANFDFEAVPMISTAQVMALTAGDSWLEEGANLLLFGPPGGGKSHLAAAIGLALVENGWRLLFMRTSDLVQRLQVPRRELDLESALTKLDKYQLYRCDFEGESSHRNFRYPTNVDPRPVRTEPRQVSVRVSSAKSGHPQSLRTVRGGSSTPPSFPI